MDSSPSEPDTDTDERPSRPRRTRPPRIESEPSDGEGESGRVRMEPEQQETPAGGTGFHVEGSNEVELDEVVSNHEIVRVWGTLCSPDDRRQLQHLQPTIWPELKQL